MRKKFRFTLRKRITVIMLIYLIALLQLSYLDLEYVSRIITIRNKTGSLKDIGAVISDTFLETDLISSLKEAADIYSRIPDEVKADQNVQDFQDYFKDYEPVTVSSYGFDVSTVISEIVKQQEMYEICFCLVDEKNNRDVVILDSDNTPAGTCHYYDVTPLEKELFQGEIIYSEDGDKPLLIGAYAPVYDEENKVVAYVHILDFTDAVDRSIAFILRISSYILAGFIILMWLSIYTMLGRVVVNPIKKLAGAAGAWTKESNKMMETSHFSKLGIKSNDELKDLNDVMEEMEESIHTYMMDLGSEVSARERMNTELEVAARIQFDMLPEPLQNDAFSVCCFMRPARLVGGDFYDYFQVDEDRTAMIIADVSDKGVPASLFMVISKTIIKMCILENPDDLLAAVTKANRLLVESNREMMFVTAFISIYSTKDNTLTYVNAGHEDPVIYNAEEGRYSVIEDEHDLFIAADPDIEFTLRKINLKHGDRFIQYTDGVTEAMNVSDELLGLNGLMNALNSDTDKEGNDIINLIWNTVSDFQKGKEQSDDVTIVILET